MHLIFKLTIMTTGIGITHCQLNIFKSFLFQSVSNNILSPVLNSNILLNFKLQYKHVKKKAWSYFLNVLNSDNKIWDQNIKIRSSILELILAVIYCILSVKKIHSLMMILEDRKIFPAKCVLTLNENFSSALGILISRF